MDILPPPDVSRLWSGDYVEGEIIHVVVPKYASDYYGPNVQLAAALTENGNTWRMIYREVLGNDLDVRVFKGTLEDTYPIRIHAPDGAEFSVTGGLGYVPMTFSGLPNYRRYILKNKVNNLWVEVNQSMHGNDFWQTDYDTKTGTWEITYTVPMDLPNDNRMSREYRFVKNAE